MDIKNSIVITLISYFGVLYFLDIMNKKCYSDNKVVSRIAGIIMWIFGIGLVFSPFVLGMLGFGAIFAFIGGISFIASVQEENNMNMFDIKANLIITGLMSFIGIIIMLISVIVYIEPESWQNIVNLVIPLFLISIFPVVGIIMLYLGSKSIKVPKEFSDEVNATCIHVKKHYVRKRGSFGRIKVYSPVYSYIYHRKEYEGCDNWYTNIGKHIKEGEHITLKINPDNPYLFWDTKRRVLFAKYYFRLGTIFTIIGSICMILFLKQEIF